ncbi:MarR family winged helix-turn-helix transcriptional regulator [Streptomyces leeuwenhoekii]|uniref:MarR family transcriptional regulator n=1 Tax=Streptomyces leeuwenhoekii TaxID=1437453 RepID=A0A0F7VM22_STRLW|nr:MarR family transcriptional regulator [Streptomyces leeuwenhoekii]KMS77562.1 MarR family transcriptional regulator [Streptomyces leeuwenhoekii]CQR60180.1 MarR Family Transcriptional Regulator [Streptomyces leeuwenhoekii]
MNDIAPSSPREPVPCEAPLPPDELAHRLTEVYDLVGPLYRRAQRGVEQGLATEGLSVGVRAVLALLHRHGPMTVPQMGRAQAISRQFVQRMVNDAAAQGLVESIPNPAHRRSSLIRLTDEGGAVIAAVLDREHALLREVGGGLTDAEVAACLRVLGLMLRGLDHVADD